MLRETHRAHALSRIPRAASVRRIRRHRSRLQGHRRLPLQAVRHVLDRARGERHPGIAMLPFQRPLRGLLGGASPGGLISTSTSRTLCLERKEERRWNQALTTEAQVEAELATLQQGREHPLTDTQKRELLSFARDPPILWNGPKSLGRSPAKDSNSRF